MGAAAAGMDKFSENEYMLSLHERAGNAPVPSRTIVFPRTG